MNKKKVTIIALIAISVISAIFIFQTTKMNKENKSTNNTVEIKNTPPSEPQKSTEKKDEDDQKEVSETNVEKESEQQDTNSNSVQSDSRSMSEILDSSSDFTKVKEETRDIDGKNFYYEYYEKKEGNYSIYIRNMNGSFQELNVTSDDMNNGVDKTGDGLVTYTEVRPDRIIIIRFVTFKDGKEDQEKYSISKIGQDGNVVPGYENQNLNTEEAQNLIKKTTEVLKNLK